MSLYKKLSVFVVVLLFLVAAFSYGFMPVYMVSHWDINSQVDDYIGRLWGVLLMPLVSLFIFVLFWLLPKIDPLKANIKKFEKYYQGFVLGILLFIFYVYLLMVLWNFGVSFSFSKALVPALSGLFYISGVVLEKTKRNWFIGIRTPWTLESDIVWEKTNKLGGKFFRLFALLLLISLFDSRLIYLLLMVMIAPLVIILFIYSYKVYRDLEKK